MAISAEKVSVNHQGMETAGNTAQVRATVTRMDRNPRPLARRESALARARTARRELRPRSERFAHLKRMYD